MVKIKNIDTLLSLLDNLKSKELYFQLYGNIEELGPQVEVLTPSGTSETVQLAASIAALTPIGEVYFHQSVKFTDESKLADFKTKLTTLFSFPIIEAKVYTSEGELVIK